MKLLSELLIIISLRRVPNANSFAFSHLLNAGHTTHSVKLEYTQGDLTEGPIPLDGENKSNQPPMYQGLLQGNADL